MAYTVSPAVVEQRRAAKTTHGAKNQVAVRRRAGYLKQSVLQASGLRQADLDPITKRYLDLWSRVAGKIELYDAWAAEHGWVDAEGNSPGIAKEYYAAINAAGRLLSKLDEHLSRHKREGPSVLDLHLQEHYGELEAGDG
jgi:hypothetical protein